MELCKITFDNVDDITSMSVREDQRNFVAPNVASLAEAYVTVDNGHAAQAFALCHEDKPVGFVMFGFGSLDDPDEPPVAAGNYCLWRFMIDQRHQGKGLGKQAMEACLAYVRALPLGPAEYVWLSYEPENVVARQLYHQFGFEENGQMCGEEVVAVLKL